MGTGNWILDNLINALNTWNARLNEIFNLVVQSPDTFKGGDLWKVVVGINGALQAIGYALLVLFFLIGVMKTFGSVAEMKRPEVAFKVFIRFILAKSVITYGLDLMVAIFKIVQGIIVKVIGSAGIGSQIQLVLPDGMKEAVEGLYFFDSLPIWAISLLGGLVIIILSFVMIMSVYGRFFKIYLYTAIAPIPMSTFAGKPSSNVGKSFLKSYAAVCLEGAIIVLACVIFSVFVSTPPGINPDSTPFSIVWSYLGELIFNLLVLTGSVKMADKVVRDIFGI